MTVTVLPILAPDTKPASPLAKVMNERLCRFARELKEIHLKMLGSAEPLYEDVVIYLSYNQKYNIRWTIVNDVPENIASMIASECNRLGYIHWKAISLYNFKDKS